MSVIETSISLYNKTLLDRIVPETMLCWQRVVLANALAHTLTYFSLVSPTQTVLFSLI